MIGRIRGMLIEKQPPHLLIDVQGIGYEVLAPLSTFYYLPEINQEITLHTHLIIREDIHQLYGFSGLPERALFRALIKVNGIGPKSALTILSGMESHEFVRAVLDQDLHRLTHIPGIGKKTAERLIMETRDALSSWQTDINKHTMQTTLLMPQESAHQDALSALTALGYKPQEAKQALLKIKEPNLTSEMLIRTALKQMMKGSAS